MELAFGNGSFSENTGGDLVFVLHVIGQSQSHGQGESASNNGVATIKTGCCVKKMHGSPPAPTASFLFAVHFRHDGPGGYSPHQGVAVFPVGAYHCVLGREHL